MKYLIYILCLVAFYGCQTKSTNTNNTEKNVSVPVKISDKRWNASGPYLTKDNQGNILLSWVQGQDSTEAYLLNYAISTDGGQTFGKPQTIPATKGIYPHDENLSKIVYKPNGDMLAMFAVSNPNPENSYAGLVFYTQSFDGGKTWTSRKQLAKDTLNSIDERYFDIALLPNGEVGAVWLDSRKDGQKEGSSLFYSVTQGRNGFVGEEIIGEQTCQCCRTDLFVDKDGSLHVAYRAILNDSIRDMMHLVSEKGKKFSMPTRISADNWVIKGCPHTGPSMASNEKGLHFAWYTMGSGSGVFYARSADKGKSFTTRESVSGLTSAKHPQIAALPNGRLLIAWDERVENTGKSIFRIGLQIREADGKLADTRFITPDSLSATHPVVSVINNDEVIVAYTKKSSAHTEVYYQVLAIE